MAFNELNCGAGSIFNVASVSANIFSKTANRMIPNPKNSYEFFARADVINWKTVVWQVIYIIIHDFRE